MEKYKTNHENYEKVKKLFHQHLVHVYEIIKYCWWKEMTLYIIEFIKFLYTCDDSYVY